MFKTFLWPIPIGLGVAGMTNHWLYASLIVFGLTGMIWRIQSWFDTYSSINGKLMIFSNHLFQSETNGDICKLSIILQIYNCSNQVISCIIDEEKTKLIVDGKTKHKFYYNKIDQLLAPYHLFNVSTDSIELDLSEKNMLDKDIRIDAEVHLKYGFKEDEKYVTSRKITNFVKLVRHANNFVMAIPIQPQEAITPPVSVRD